MVILYLLPASHFGPIISGFGSGCSVNASLKPDNDIGNDDDKDIENEIKEFKSLLQRK